MFIVIAFITFILYRHLYFITFFIRDAVVPRDMRHPKLLKLEEVILDHFKKFGKSNLK
jgi:hypothetical protein